MNQVLYRSWRLTMDISAGCFRRLYGTQHRSAIPSHSINGSGMTVKRLYFGGIVYLMSCPVALCCQSLHFGPYDMHFSSSTMSEKRPPHQLTAIQGAEDRPQRGQVARDSTVKNTPSHMRSNFSLQYLNSNQRW